MIPLSQSPDGFVKLYVRENDKPWFVVEAANSTSKMVKIFSRDEIEGMDVITDPAHLDDLEPEHRVAVPASIAADYLGWPLS